MYEIESCNKNCHKIVVQISFVFYYFLIFFKVSNMIWRYNEHYPIVNWGNPAILPYIDSDSVHTDTKRATNTER